MRRLRGGSPPDSVQSQPWPPPVCHRASQGDSFPELAAEYKYLANEWQFIQQYSRNCVDGDPEQIKAGLEKVAEDYQTPDLSVVTICYHYEDRVRSYELVAQACGLEPLTT